jgi:N-acetyl-anhydromuramyl-L-alanine amidase AmpD
MWAGRNGHTAKYVIIHGTAGGTSAVAIANYFKSTEGSPTDPKSTHYIIGTDGQIVQVIAEANTAWGNGILSAGHDPWWSTGLNPNFVTISIEHCKASQDNSDELTEAQKAASFLLIKHICERHNVPKRKADARGGITGHCSIDPVSRSHCPGPYPWDDLFAYLTEEDTVNNIDQLKAAGWKYEEQQKIWTAPNGFLVQHGFAEEVSTAWNPQDYPLENEQHCDQLELSNPALGGGSRQRFRLTTLEWTQARGVFRGWTGQELIELEHRLQVAESKATLSDALHQALTKAQSAIDEALKS